MLHCLGSFPKLPKQKGKVSIPWSDIILDDLCNSEKKLSVNKFYWKIVEGEGSEFSDVPTVLNNVMKYVY